MNSPLAGLLPDGRRLHLQHGPIDLVIEAFGPRDEIGAAYRQARTRFETVLTELVEELAVLRQPEDGRERAAVGLRCSKGQNDRAERLLGHPRVAGGRAVLVQPERLPQVLEPGVHPHVVVFLDVLRELHAVGGERGALEAEARSALAVELEVPAKSHTPL